MNRLLAERHAVTVCCGAFPGATPRDEPFDVRFMGRARHYVESRLQFMWRSRRINPRPYDLVVEEFSYYAPVFSLFAERPVVTVLQGRHGLGALSARGIYGLLSLASEYLLLPRRRAVILVSEHLRPAVGRRTQTLVLGQGTAIPDGLPPPGEDHVLFLGRLDVWHKGIDTLVRAWARLPRPCFPLVVAGNGDPAAVERLVRDAGARRVRLVGRLNHADALAAIRRAAFVCLPSRMEGSPLVLYEALALGKPVVASDIAPIAAVLPHGLAGLRVLPGSEKALAEALAQLMGDGRLRRRMGTAAAELGKRYTWRAVADRQERFYREVLARWPG